MSDLTLLGKGPSASCLSPRLVRRGSEWSEVTLNQRKIWGLNPGPLTPNPDFLRIGCLAGRFPFALSSHTVSAVLTARGSMRGQVSCLPPILSQCCWHGETPPGVGPETEMEKMVPGTLLSSPAPTASPSLRGCLYSELPFLLASYLSV